MITVYSIYTQFKPTNRALNWGETQAVVLDLGGIEKPYKKGFTITAFESENKYFTLRTQKSGKIKLAQHSSHQIVSYEKLLRIAKRIIKTSENEAKSKGDDLPIYLQEFPIVHSHPTKEEFKQLMNLEGFDYSLRNSFDHNRSKIKMKTI